MGEQMKLTLFTPYVGYVGTQNMVAYVLRSLCIRDHDTSFCCHVTMYSGECLVRVSTLICCIQHAQLQFYQENMENHYQRKSARSQAWMDWDFI